MKKLITLVSIFMLMLVQSQACQTSYANVSNVTICTNSFYTFNNQQLSASGMYYDTLVNAGGCDSIVPLNLIVIPKVFNSSASICVGNTYLFKGLNLSVAGIYYDSLLNYLGCDSILQLTLSVSSTYPATQQLTSNVINVCGTSPVNFTVNEKDTTTTIPPSNCNGTNGGKLCLNAVFLNGAYTAFNHTAGPFYHGATSSSITNLVKGNAYYLATYIDTSYLYNNGATVFMWMDINHNGIFDPSELLENTTTTNYTSFNYANYNFSIPANALTGATLMRIRTVALGSLSASACANFTTGSTDDFKIYIQPGNNTYDLQNSTLPNSVYSSTLNVFNSPIPTSGFYKVKVTNQQGCSILSDSIQLNALSASADTIYDTVCQGSYNFFGQNINQTGSYVQHLTNAVGCDSAITLILLSNMGFSSSTQSICHGASVVFNNQTITLAGTYYDTLTNYKGCDSLITFTVNYPTSYTYIYNYLCAGLTQTFNNQVLTTSGVYYDTLPDYQLCGDSIIGLVLTIYNPLIANAGNDYSGCGSNGITIGSSSANGGSGNYTYSWSPTIGLNANNISNPTATPTSSITYTVTVIDNIGCTASDSMIYTLGGIPSNTNINQSICNGSSYLFNNQNLTTSGVYKDTLISSTSCDSIITLNLIVNQATSSSIQNSICANSGFVFNNQMPTASGIYKDTLTNYLGCDSIITLNLIVNQVTSSSIQNSICANSGFVFNNQMPTASGIYKDTLTNYLGCDSIITLNLTVLSTSSSSFNQSICANNTYFFNGKNLSIAGNYNDTLVNHVGCDSIVTLHLTVNPLPVATFTAQYRSCTNTNSIADIIFTGNNATTFAWSFVGASPASSSTSNNTISYSTIGTHSVNLTATSAFGCLVVVSDTVALGNNCVWPGDANNDKVADNLDIFPIGLLNGVVGPIRANASLIWNDQPANIWGTNIPGTLIDAQHADCNGDGVVDGNDTVAILQNYGNTHLRQKGGAGNLVTLTVGPDTLYQNTTATILVGLGTASLPADSIYGVAFSFNVDPTAIDTNSINVSIPPSWLFANSTDHFNIFKLDKSATKVHVGLVRNNQVAKSGFGNFITITIDITSGNIVGRETDLFNRKYKLKCSIDNISILKLDGTIVNPITVEDSASTVFYNSNIGINAINKIPLSASIYPNPTTNKSALMIKGAEQNEIKNVLIVDVFGKVISEKIIATNQTEIDLSALQSGLYLVKVITKNGISESKIIKQ